MAAMRALGGSRMCTAQSEVLGLWTPGHSGLSAVQPRVWLLSTVIRMRRRSGWGDTEGVSFWQWLQ